MAGAAMRTLLTGLDPDQTQVVKDILAGYIKIGRASCRERVLTGV